VTALLDPAPSVPGMAAGPARDTRLAEWLVVTVLAVVIANNVPTTTPMAVTLLAPALGLYGLVLARRMGGLARAGALGLVVLLMAGLPAYDGIDGMATGTPTYGHDGGVHQTRRAGELLLTGRDPYTASYADVLARVPITVDRAIVANPVTERYSYEPLTILVQLPVQAPLRALGERGDPRFVYLAVYLALYAFLCRWSLRARGDLLLPAVLLLNPVLVTFLWLGVTDVLLLAGLAVAAWALAARRTVAAGLALGLALATKLLLAPVGLVFAAWVAGRAAAGLLPVRTAVRTGIALAAPALVCALPFLLWHPGAFLGDVLWYHLGLTPDRYPIVGSGLPALLVDLDVITDRLDPAPVWSTLLPSLAAAAVACRVAWRRHDPAGFLLTAGGCFLAAVYFSRYFMATYWQVPMALAALALLVPFDRLERQHELKP